MDEAEKVQDEVEGLEMAEIKAPGRPAPRALKQGTDPPDSSFQAGGDPKVASVCNINGVA